MKEAVIVAAARTPIGRCRGALASVPAHQLGALAVREAVRRSGIDPVRIDDVIFANLMNHEINNMGRMVALEAGLPTSVPGITLDRQCSASLNALAYGAIQIMAGFADVIVAGGVESDSRRTGHWRKPTPRGPYNRRALRRSIPRPMPWATHRWASPRKTSLPVTTLAASNWTPLRYAAIGWRARHWQAGRFAQQIVPVPLRGKKGQISQWDHDESVRADCSAEGPSRAASQFSCGRSRYRGQQLAHERRCWRAGGDGARTGATARIEAAGGVSRLCGRGRRSELYGPRASPRLRQIVASDRVTCRRHRAVGA